VAVAVKHLRDHPSELHQPFIKLAVAALKEAAWPCAANATEGAAARIARGVLNLPHSKEAFQATETHRTLDTTRSVAKGIGTRGDFARRIT
jgi:hypothetical protein